MKKLISVIFLLGLVACEPLAARPILQTDLQLSGTLNKLKNGAVFTIDNGATVYVANGGSLIIQSGGILTAESGSVLSGVSGGGGLTDGDKGDITVFSGAWTIDPGVVSLSKMANMATASLLGRNTAGTGAPEVLSASTAKSLLSLNNVNNTSDASKPVSTATQIALDAKLDAAGGIVAHGNAGSAVTLTWSALNPTHTLTLNQATCTITLAGFPASKDATITAKISMDATGGRAATYSPTLAGGGTPTLDTTTNAVTWLQFWSDDGGTTVYYVSTADTGTSGGGGPQSFATLTDGATITWTVDSDYATQNAKVTLGGNRTLAISGATSGMHGLLMVTQDGTGSRTLTPPSGSRVEGNGAGLLTLSTGAGRTDKVNWCYDGSYFYFDTPKLYYTAASDTTPPTLSSATIGSNGTTFTMVFNESVSIGSGGNSGFVPTLSAGSPTLSYSSGSGSTTLVYTLSATVNSGVTGTIAYTQPGNGVEDAAGNDLATFSGTSITNNSTQPAPTLTSATIASNGTTITLVFSEAVTRGGSYSNSHFDLDASGSGSNQTFTYVSGDGTNTWTGTVGATIQSGETVDLDFGGAANSVEDSGGNDLAAIVSASVTNNSTQGGGGPTQILNVAFNEGTGTSAAATVGPNMTLDAGTLWTAQGSGYAIVPSGAHQATTDSNLTFGSVVTASVWVKSNDWASAATNRYLPGTQYFAAYVAPSSSTIKAYINGTGGTKKAVTFTTNAVTAASYHHYVFVFDNTTTAGTIKCYVDSVASTIASTDQNDKNVSGAITADAMTLGYNVTSPSSLDDLRVWNGELNQAAIDALYAAGPQ